MHKPRPSQPISSETDQSSQESELDSALTPSSKNMPHKHHTQRRRYALRAGLAIVAGRTAGAVSRRLHLGGGTSVAGIVAQRVYPDIVKHLATELEHGSVAITGTNGKTTTSSFIAAILRDGGLRVWHNREGSNLMRGVASTLVIRAQPDGHLRGSGKAISILEVDEAALPQLVKAAPPRVIVFTNLFRDQLDRYGEVDSVVNHWQRAISQLPETTTLVLNADDPTIASLGLSFKGKVLYYGIDDLSLDLMQQADAAERHQVMDARTCPNCGGEYIYEARFYSHMGHYACPNCSFRRPTPDVRATRIKLDSFDSQQLTVTVGTEQHTIAVPLPGLYNVYNALASLAAALAVEVSWQAITSGIEQAKPVFGRGERIVAGDKTMRLMLAKNPTGFNEVLRTLFSDNTPRHMLIILNDNTADGKDISWIWDVDFERATGFTRSVVVTGTRAFDLALRLKYAGIEPENVTMVPLSPLRASRGEAQKAHKRTHKTADVIATEQADGQMTRQYGLKNAIDRALQQTPVGETLFVIPTYTGLLEVHRELEQRGLISHYWKGNQG